MTRELSVVVPAPAEEVRAFLCDLTRLRGIHPLVVAVDVGPETHGGRQFTITDRLAIGGRAVTSRYSVVIGLSPDGDVVAEAKGFPWLRVHTRYRLTPVDGGTRVIEELRTCAPLGLRRWLHKQAAQAHRATLDRLPQAFA